MASVLKTGLPLFGKARHTLKISIDRGGVGPQIAIALFCVSARSVERKHSLKFV
jgi:hypothetical protein